MGDYNNCTHISATVVDPEWDPHDPSFSDQEDALLTTVRGRFVAGMHLNPCKSLQECGNGNLENFLTAHIIVSSVGGQASTWMQPTEPTYLAEKWGIGLEAARCTLECTTKRVLWKVIHTSL